MSADIFTFLSNFRGGGARANRYEVHLTFPSGVAGAVVAAQKISFTCTAASIPSSQLGTAIVPYKGRQIKVPGDKTFDDWNVTIALDNDWIGRSIFERWHDAMNGFTSNLTVPNMINPTNVFATAQVHQMDRADRIIQTYEVEAIWPTVVAEATLGYAENDAVMLQQVTFAVNNWRSGSTT